MRILTTLILAGGTSAMLALTGCQMVNRHTEESSGRSAGRVFDDKEITSEVEDGLKDERVYKLDNVDVRTFAGVVQLSGFVDSQGQKDRAGEIAQRQNGVVQVDNNISLKPAPMLTPTGNQNSNYNDNSQPQNQQPQTQQGKNQPANQ